MNPELKSLLKESKGDEDLVSLIQEELKDLQGREEELLQRLTMALLHDVHPDTRLQAAAALSQFAGGWSALTEGELGGLGSEDLALAIDGILASFLLADTDGFDPVSEAAFTRLADAPIADKWTSDWAPESAAA